MIRKILTYPGDVETLRYKCHQIYHDVDRSRPIGSRVSNPMAIPALKEIADDLTETLRSTSEGVGLAANQIGYKVRMFAFRYQPAPEPYEDKIIVCIDPVVTPMEYMQNMVTMCESCLSVPDLRCGVPVTRLSTCALGYIDMDGVIVEAPMVGLNSQIVQHEVDHLDGKLIIDMVEKSQSVML